MNYDVYLQGVTAVAMVMVLLLLLRNAYRKPKVPTVADTPVDKLLQLVQDSSYLDLLESTGYSLHCVNGQWAATDANSQVLDHSLTATPRDTLRAAFYPAESAQP